MTPTRFLVRLCRPVRQLAGALLLAGLAACGGGEMTEPAAQVAAEVADGAEAVSRSAAQAAALPVDLRCAATWKNLGCVEQRKLVVGNQLREFIVWTPHTARLRAQAPVVFMLHGTNQDGEQFFNHSGWREEAIKRGVIAVFPTALVHCYHQDDNHRPIDGNEATHILTKWADGRLGGPNADRPLCTPAEIQAMNLSKKQLLQLAHGLADDMGFFRAMVDLLKAEYAVDPKRIYVSGFSNGAEMSGRLAAEMSEVFAAAHCGSSTVGVSTVATRAIPVVHSMGSQDDEQKDRLGYPDGLPLDETLMTDPTKRAYHDAVVKPFLDMLQLNDAYQWHRQLINKRLTSWFTFRSSQTGATTSFRAIVIQGATHEYPNGKNHPVVMAEELWPFFEANPLP